MRTATLPSNGLARLGSVLALTLASSTLHAAVPARADIDDTVADNQERVCARLLARAEQDPRLELVRTEHERSGTVFVQGTYEVPETRPPEGADDGRTLRIGFAVLPARSADPAPDPVMFLHGGPGAPATQFFRRELRGWLRERHDVVLIDQRGTGSSNPLTVPLPGHDDDLQGYLRSYFVPEVFRAALPELQARADLTQYTTPNSVDDFDELREALGYEQVNLRGGSYGTRAALVYMRRHPDSIRTATLQGVQPISYLNPLPHARSAQEALDQIFEEIQTTPRYAEAFPQIEENFWATIARLEEAPAEVTVRHPVTEEEHTVLLSRNAFAESVRLQLYTMESNRRLPLLLQQAHAGDFQQLTEASIQMSRAVRGLIAWGMLICVTESEDLGRVDLDEIEPACEGTFLGTTRIRDQLAIAAFWPSGTVPPEFAEPVSVDVPTLLFSGSHDPATTAAWGAEAASHLPNSLHVVVPGGHGVSGPEIQRLDAAFLEQGSVEGLDLTEVQALELPELVLPAGTGDTGDTGERGDR